MGMYIKSGKIGLFKTVNALIIAIAGFFAFGNLLFSVFTLTSEEFGTNVRAYWVIGFILFLMSAKIGIIIWRAILIHRVLKCRKRRGLKAEWYYEIYDITGSDLNKAGGWIR